MPTSRALATLSALVLVPWLPARGHAQEGLPLGGERPLVQIELAKPFFEDQSPSGSGFGFATSILDATVVIPTGGPILFARLGVAYATLEGTDASTTISNPRLGVLFTGEGTTHGELHVDLPFANEIGNDDYATGVAITSDIERLERFNPEAWSVGGSITPEKRLESGSILGARVGAKVWLPTEDGEDTELFAVYSSFATFALGEADLGGELSGIAILTEGDLDFGERTLFLATLSLGLPGVRGSPEVFVRLPLDEDTRTGGVDAVVGLRVHLGG